MKFLLRLVGVLVAVVVGFAVVSYFMFGDNPSSRLTLELDHDMAVGAVTIQTTSEVSGCDLDVTFTQVDAEGTVLVGEKLSVQFKDLAAATTTSGPGYIGFALPAGSMATCVDLNGAACSKAERSDVQLNLPKIKTDDQVNRVLGWIDELAQSCEG